MRAHDGRHRNGSTAALAEVVNRCQGRHRRMSPSSRRRRPILSSPNLCGETLPPPQDRRSAEFSVAERLRCDDSVAVGHGDSCLAVSLRVHLVTPSGSSGADGVTNHPRSGPTGACDWPAERARVVGASVRGLAVWPGRRRRRGLPRGGGGDLLGVVVGVFGVDLEPRLDAVGAALGVGARARPSRRRSGGQGSQQCL